MIPPDDLLNRWQADEARFRQYGQDGIADVIGRCRTDLETWWRERQLDRLTIEEAAAYSALARGTIANKIASGAIPNAGDKGRPRVRRCDLPARAPGSPQPRAVRLELADKILLQ